MVVLDGDASGIIDGLEKMKDVFEYNLLIMGYSVYITTIYHFFF